VIFADDCRAKTPVGSFGEVNRQTTIIEFSQRRADRAGNS